MGEAARRAYEKQARLIEARIRWERERDRTEAAWATAWIVTAITIGLALGGLIAMAFSGVV